MYIFLKIAMLILQYKFQRMKNEHNCRHMQSSFPRLQQNRRVKDLDLDELDQLLEPFRSRSERSSNGLNDSSDRNSAERHQDGTSPRNEQIGECVEKIFGCLNKLQDIIKSHRSNSIPQESRGSQEQPHNRIMFQPEAQILNIKPNVKLMAGASQIIDLRDDEPEEEAQTFEQLFNPLNNLLKKPMERLEEDPTLATQEIPLGQQQRPMNPDQQSWKEVEKVIVLSDSIKNPPSVEVTSVRAPKKKKKIRKSMRILSRNERLAIDLDDEESAKNERVAYEISESDPERNANETDQPEHEESQVLVEADRGPQREVVEHQPMEIQDQAEVRQEMPLPLEEESDSEPELEALPAEQNNITHLSSRQVSELIISSGSEGRHTSRDQRITEEFESVIRIVSSRPLSNNKLYKWQLGPQRFWKTLSEALSSNFEIFIKESEKYRAKFLKYLPEDVKFKKENIFKVEQFHGEGINVEMKLERAEEERSRRKRKELASLKKLFNKVQLAKVTEYERRKEERSDSSDGEESKFTEYEPEEGTVNEILADLVAKTNERMRSKKTKSLIISESSDNRGEEKAENEMVVYRLTEAIDNFNYVENMRRIFELNKKVLSLSCLEALRSNNLKEIDKPTFEAEMRRLKLMEEAIVLPDDQGEPSFQAEPPRYLKMQKMRLAE